MFTIANNSTLTGLNITGGEDGVSGTDATGFTISNNTISGVGQHGINLAGTTHGADIRYNAIRDNTGGDGLHISNFASGEIKNNSASGNADGFSSWHRWWGRHNGEHGQRKLVARLLVLHG